ncbi:S1 RNA-binding domain-containing protein [Falcatimonas sp. MSJ-15]|uniref:S1 RNA-binding domain-containing protein n=1 Tax=Falcatimonas sp. MSJ-15 TaxID=2841515 RepID=UPI001C1124EA|nr:S1 RNA-binding domain-containing protein [Falcatimonas sp. MSJ-15]MBU5471053.1 S1 RNA-binding domain-containing protein [Falcatimonas sp. MSJ-15]
MINETSNENLSMKDFENELNKSMRRINEGDILTGTVISVSDKEVIVDLGYYAEGIISVENLSNDPEYNVFESVHEGDELSATVVKLDDGDGNIVLSKKEANNILAWEKLNELKANHTVVHTKVSGIVNAGVIAYVEGIRGFIPASKLDVNYVEDLNEWLMKDIDVHVITVDEADKKLVLSAKEIAMEKAAKENSKKAAKVSVGSVLTGVVESLTNYGAFIELPNGVSGLLHISQISDKHIKSPSSVLKQGQEVTVKVIGNENGKISLSIKALNDVAAEPDENEEFEEMETEAASTSLGSLLAGFKFDK